MTAKQSEIKTAYLKLAKELHPDVNNDQFAKEDFAKLSEAYKTLMDSTKRHQYDQHRYPVGDFVKKSSIYEWESKYSIYNENPGMRRRWLDDWFESRGHSVDREKITIRQRVKNAWVEMCFGFHYYDFPWKLKLLCLEVAVASLFLYIFKTYFEKLIQSVQYNPPIPLNIRWKFNEERDIMWFFGARSQTPHPEMAKIHKQKGLDNFYTRKNNPKRRVVRQKKVQNPENLSLAPKDVQSLKEKEIQSLKEKEIQRKRLENMEELEMMRHEKKMERIRRSKLKNELK